MKNDVNKGPNLSGWSVDRVKVSRMASHETLCFGAFVLLDGKQVGTAFNEGHGGPTHVTIKEEFLRVMTVPAGLAEHVDRLVEDYDQVKRLAKTYRRWCKELDAGRCFVLRHDELKAWESRDTHQNRHVPPFRAYSSVGRAIKDNVGRVGAFYTAQAKAALWDAMMDAHRKWKVLEDARVEKMLADYEAKTQAQAKSQSFQTGGPEENEDYFRKKPSAEEVHRREIGKILERHLTANLPLPATVRLEALKLLSEACVIIDDEDLSPAALLAYYVQYVVPDLP
jgi:hypothetical protein